MVASQSVVGRANAEKAHGIVGLLKNPFVFLTCCFASLGCIMYGYDQGVMGPILVMENFQNHFPTFTGSTIQGWLVSALELGAWAGALINGVLADRISRKYAMMSAVWIFTLGTGLQAGAQTPAYFFAGRVIGGVGIGMFSMVIPLYQAEIAPPELRGSLVSLQQLSITIGTAIAFWLDYGMQYVGGTTCNPEGISNPYLTDGSYNAAVNNGHTCLGQKTIAWRLPLALQIIPAWILFFGMFWFPFSPRWLMMKHREEDALTSLSKLRRLPAADPLVRAEFLEIKAAVMFDEETESEAIGAGGALAPWKALFAPNMMKRLFLGCGTMICQQFTGINAVLYYAPQIFASFGFSSTKQTLLATGVTGILQIIFTLPAVLYLDKFGRKTFLIVGAIGMFLCHIVVATVEGIFKPKWDLNMGLDQGQGWVAIVFIWLFAVNFAYSWGPVAWVLTQEIFPNSQRSKGVAIVASTNWLFNFIIGLTTKDMLNTMKYGTYIFFAIFSGLGGLFIWWFAPETKDKTLEELDVFFGGSEASIAEADRLRMQRINESLGLAGVENVEDLKVAVTSEQVEM
ncbi:Major facilitator superfamily domain general substrate transporter [Penicillium atrosanguineum]|uniref:Major facilitator superfamily domain general substrate transporter n=1 Tax=Penicillium atrosanguineum TaxID=1132637 RepID=A0A9W9HE59_9EURO|nr:Arginine permease CAN1 [Penicillium atrosanguineum]KAJ5129082.1 Major facilitator superfamily domain general substrate transporter [Penicillium atrosanguineum]KAJ5145401.1 Major facilitator superfamily domain general substrate transporter [Penicillium atrosanguineum]KAJ5301196.1 Arginine permease CAN1 [Penicillium atrosanguineum]KAJ5311840.1 Major facilitator superfamily domain general substrate transporter [Penicillium atrosanguineum]